MKGLFIPDITAEMFRNGCLEGIEALMAEGEIYDIDYEPERRGEWEVVKCNDGVSIDFRCSKCHRYRFHNGEMRAKYKFCPNCGAKMGGKKER